MCGSDAKVQIPTKACGDGDDLGRPTISLLRELQLLGSKEEMDDARGLGAAFRGPPQSVALIESGATAFSKVWAAGLGASALGVATAGYQAWTRMEEVRGPVAIAAGIVVATLLLALAHIIASDVRGRARAAAATIEARAGIAMSLTRAAQCCGAKESDATSDQDSQVVSVTPQPVHYTAKPSSDEEGWRVIAMDIAPGRPNRYLLVKGSVQEWADGSDVNFLESGRKRRR